MDRGSEESRDKEGAGQPEAPEAGGAQPPLHQLAVQRRLAKMQKERRAKAENPQDLSGSDPTKTTDVDPTEGYAGPKAPDNSQTPGQCEPMDVSIVHGETNPMLIDGAPNEGDLYQRVLPGMGTHVEMELGTIQSPYVKEGVDPETLYIGGRPVEQDIQQGEIGDCYFQAALHQIVTRDPGKIQSMMRLGGDTVTVSFYRYDNGSKQYVETPVTTDRKLAQDVDPKTGEVNGDIHGAGFRVSPKPDRSEWYAKVKGNYLGVVRKDIYQTAMWAPLLEKAYARFSEQFGQYGGSPAANQEGLSVNSQTDGKGKQKSGYEIIDGGFENLVYNMFYGSQVSRQAEISTQFDPTKNVVQANIPAMQLLLEMQGKGGGGKKQMMLTASSDHSIVFDRIAALVNVALSSPGADHWPEAFRGSLTYLKELIQTWSTVQNDQAKEPKATNKIARTARDIAAPASWPMLHRESTPQVLKNLLEALDDAENAGTDNDRGQRMVYTEHAYSITGLVLRNKSGEDLQVDLKNLGQKAADIDAHKSMVMIRNPHRTNEPDVHGRGKPDDGVDDGNFTLNLEQFFRNFTTMDFAEIKR